MAATLSGISLSTPGFLAKAIEAPTVKSPWLKLSQPWKKSTQFSAGHYPIIGEQLDILEFWKSRSCHYPIMAAMARDILTVQASTVASESAFSFSGRVLNERRSRLNPQSLEVCICYKDHLDAEKRRQDVVSSEESSGEEEIFTENEGDSS